MKRLLSILAACTLLLAVLPGVYAQEETVPVVVIGDGASIPYLDGFESRLVRDAETITGIAGAFPHATAFEQPDTVKYAQIESGSWTFELQNLVLTDDVLGLFFKQTYSIPFPIEGDFAFAYGLAARMPEILVDGENLSMLNSFKEGYPIDETSQYSFVLWSLPQPIADGQVLTFGAQWNNDSQAWEGGIDFVVDRSRANDPTVVYTPSQNVKKTIALWESVAAVNYNFNVERVAYTPFGNRMLIRFTGTCENNQYMDCQLMDDTGAMLNIIPTMQRFKTNASKAHPVEILNEIWFFGGENSQSLTLVPLGGNWQTSNKAQRTASIPIDSLPADVKLENGVTLHVESFELAESGFSVRYTTDGYAGYVSFDLGDAEGTPLGLMFASYQLNDHSQRLLGSGGYWCEEYKGETVSRVTPEQLSQVKTLLIDYTVGCPKLIEDEAIEIPLSE